MVWDGSDLNDRLVPSPYCGQSCHTLGQLERTIIRALSQFILKT